MEKFLDKNLNELHKESVMVSLKALSWHLHIENIPCHHSLRVLRQQTDETPSTYIDDNCK